MEIEFDAVYEEIGDAKLAAVPSSTNKYALRLLGSKEGTYNLTVSRFEGNRMEATTSQMGSTIEGKADEYEAVGDARSLIAKPFGLFEISWLSYPILLRSITGILIH